jgi:hypothetical protein
MYNHIWKESSAPTACRKMILIPIGVTPSQLVVKLLVSLDVYVLRQWYSNWGMCTPGGTQRHLRGYVKSHQQGRTTLINI